MAFYYRMFNLRARVHLAEYKCFPHGYYAYMIPVPKLLTSSVKVAIRLTAQWISDGVTERFKGEMTGQPMLARDGEEEPSGVETPGDPSGLEDLAEIELEDD